MSVFKDISAEFGSIFSRDNINDVIEFYFGISSTEISNKMLVNPLLLFQNNKASFKYDFLSNYFITLYLIDSILANTVNKYSIKHLSNLYSGKNQMLIDLASFFSANKKGINAAISNFLVTLLNLLVITDLGD